MLNDQITTKQPREVFEDVFAFPPNRDTMGGTAYLIRQTGGQSEDISENILVDCPAWELTHQTFLQEQGGVRWLFLTHRGGIGRVREIQQRFGCEVLIQEQEAYLLPGVELTRFQQDFQINQQGHAIWTSGHSPGSACLYCDRHSGILFTGRHLLPNQHGDPTPLRIAKTFHWPRQIQNVQRIIDQFTPETLSFICPGANTGFLRGKRAIDQAYQRLSLLDLSAHLQVKPLL
ncbi:MAG: MBL fold metallo-hydrolase [Leptolyngbyaceae cyanobacterium RM1_406_9]|nr:MBL fold metallo-hydrolase [Leptolyngbyaceae cyanobacterium RM1_406_9]